MEIIPILYCLGLKDEKDRENYFSTISFTFTFLFRYVVNIISPACQENPSQYFDAWLFESTDMKHTITKRQLHVKYYQESLLFSLVFQASFQKDFAIQLHIRCLCFYYL